MVPLIIFQFFFSVVEDDYDGPRLSEGGITKEFVEELIERFRDQKKIHKKYAYKVTRFSGLLLHLLLVLCELEYGT